MHARSKVEQGKVLQKAIEQGQLFRLVIFITYLEHRCRLEANGAANWNAIAAPGPFRLRSYFEAGWNSHGHVEGPCGTEAASSNEWQCASELACAALSSALAAPSALEW